MRSRNSLHTLLLVAATLALGTLAACGDREQTIGVSSSRALDQPAWDVSSSDPYVASGWKPGDKASWEDHMKRRTQMQNDYAPR